MSLPFSEEQIAKFWANVDKTPGLGVGDCWEWRGKVDAGGYGRVNHAAWKGQQKAHRIAYWLTHGILTPDLNVLHRCDNRLCVNAEKHLYEGTHADNGRDKAERGRASRLKGEVNPWSKLTQLQVDEIRSKFKSGVASRKLAIDYGCTRTTIDRIVNNQGWIDKQNYQPPQRAIIYINEPKLTYELAKEIRELYLSGNDSFTALGKRFGVSHQEIGRVVKNEVFKDSSYSPPKNLNERINSVRLKGEDNPASKLTRQQVEEIRANFQDGVTVFTEVAKRYGVDISLIISVIDGKFWKDPSYTPPERKKLEQKITPEMHSEIYRLYAEEGINQKDLAVKFGVSWSRIKKITCAYKKKHSL